MLKFKNDEQKSQFLAQIQVRHDEDVDKARTEGVIEGLAMGLVAIIGFAVIDAVIPIWKKK